MHPLSEIANLIRSKNAGPFVLTFDIMLSSEADYDRVKASGQMTTENFASLYRCPIETVRFFECRNALAFKFSIPRPITQGDIGDADMHGGQQFAPLMGIMIP
ncbi:DUF4387 domain-containing protein [Beijerinckia indica]|uniref:DUF4387 domain-containing protein n=1 Tax=Beijerinckia indica subsp. indica (strain ATCC 9039 / DSM 1715 / NCIMB 8712) TaxID=395963 RepID=B2IIW2_BEII9|nr:DUF4387 domain-containing protein [Beijerinckia indica]ACB96174.1 conserved hypothetical protein [Beijerinckia indica subsp. indica ATCC 9039]